MPIQRAYGAGNALTEARKLMANVVAGQFLPEGVVKGGSSIRLRYGTTATRFTFDLDTAWKSDLDGVRPTLEDAVAWANEFISRIDSAE